VQRFFAAAEEGDSEALLKRVSQLMINWMRMGRQIGGLIEPAWVNGQPGARLLDPAGELINVISFDVLDGHVQAVRSVVNPEKLGHLGPLADVQALLRRR
jgi:RNA polymerase sigma-70 factor, ECF subfamily